ncbi:MAG: Ig-like domain-containing protein [Spirochaetaceae bacterium]|nr:Ig-like domain-containing protein [Spirochaetaceae bacterium]
MKYFQTVVMIMFLFMSGHFLVPEDDTTRPVVSIVSPSEGTNISGELSITAQASDNDGVFKVSFYINGLKIGEDTSAPYEATWNSIYLPLGDHQLTATAYDKTGNTRQSEVVTVTLEPGANPGGIEEDFQSYELGELELGDLSSHWLADSFGDSSLRIIEVAEANYSKVLQIMDFENSGDYNLCNATFPSLDQGRIYLDMYFNQSSSLLINLQRLEVNIDNSLFPISIYLEPDITGEILLGYSNGDSIYTNNTYLSINQWHQLIIEFNCSSGLYNIYLDGNMVEAALDYDDNAAQINNVSFMTLDSIDGQCDVYLDNLSLTSHSVDFPIPEAPTDFTASMTSYTSCNLEWTDNSDNESGFYLYRYQDVNDFSDLTLIQLDENTISYNDEDLVAGESYHYALDSFNDNGSSDLVEYSVTLLNAVTDLRASVGTYNDGVHLSWSYQNYVEYYYIYRWQNDSEGWVYLGRIEGSSNAVTDDTAIAGVDYYYSISVVDYNLNYGQYYEVIMEGPVLGNRGY